VYIHGRGHDESCSVAYRQTELSTDTDLTASWCAGQEFDSAPRLQSQGFGRAFVNWAPLTMLGALSSGRPLDEGRRRADDCILEPTVGRAVLDRLSATRPLSMR